MKFIFILSICWITLFNMGCTKLDVIQLNNVAIIGHGGLGVASIYPMNTYESILGCLALGADGFEVDVQMTKDGVLITYHDEYITINNTPYHIYQLTYKEIAEIRINAYPNISFKIPHMDSLLASIYDYNNAIITFDCKLFANHTLSYIDSFTAAINSVILKHKDRFTFNIEAQETIFLNENQANNLNTFYYANEFEEGLQIASNNNYTGITISKEKLNKNNVSKAHNLNIKVATFNLHNYKNNIEAIEMGVDYIQTDAIKKIINKKY